MTGIFKSGNRLNNLLLLFYGALLKLSFFLYPVTPEPKPIDGFLYKEFLNWLHPMGLVWPYIYPLITFALFYGQAVAFNKMINDQRIMQKPNYLTGMCYLLITSLFPEWNILSAPLIINSFLIWVWMKMSGLHNNHKPKAALFNIGMVIGICTFFYFPSLAFAALIIFGLAITRPFKLNEWLLALLGIVAPYYFLLSIVFLTDRWQQYKFPTFVVRNPLLLVNAWMYISIVLIVSVAGIGVYFVQQNFRKQLIQVRKSWNVMYLYLLVALFVPFVNDTKSFTYWLLAAVPFSALMGAAFFYPEKKWFPVSMQWVLIVLVIAVNYFLH